MPERMNAAQRAAAMGIPVWPGCTDIDGDHVASVHGDRVYLWTDENEPASSVPARMCAPDLADPDTRAAYDRRLAIVLGCPDDGRLDRMFRIEVGSALGSAPIGHLLLTSDGWRVTVPVGTTDPILARALAWPADKRVTT